MITVAREMKGRKSKFGTPSMLEPARYISMLCSCFAQMLSIRRNSRFRKHSCCLSRWVKEVVIVGWIRRRGLVQILARMEGRMVVIDGC